MIGSPLEHECAVLTPNASGLFIMSCNILFYSLQFALLLGKREGSVWLFLQYICYSSLIWFAPNWPLNLRIGHVNFFAKE